MGVRGVEREVLRVLAEGEEAYDLHMLDEKLVHPMQGEDASPATSSSSSSPTTRARTQARRSGIGIFGPIVYWDLVWIRSVALGVSDVQINS
jgi:hypothetical protein